MKKSHALLLLLVLYVVFVIAARLIGKQFSPDNWRSLYDTLMLFGNFAVLASLIVGFGGKPIVNFLKGQGKAVAEEIGRIEAEKARIQAEMDELQEKIKNRDQAMANLVERTREMAEMRKQEIIDQAREEGKNLIEDAKTRSQFRILEAKKRFRGELIDLAMEIAEEHLPQVMTSEDQGRFVNLYLEQAAKS